MFKGDLGSHKRAGVHGLILSLAARRICAGTVVAIPEFTGMRRQVVFAFLVFLKPRAMVLGARFW
jgi:hypothetical protein